MSEPLVSANQALEQVRRADQSLNAALDGLDTYPNRVRTLARAAELVSRAWTLADLADLQWEARPGARGISLAYELTAAGDRPGPKAVWRDYDAAERELGEALEGDDIKTLINAWAQLAAALNAVADALAEPTTQQSSSAQAG